MVINFYYYKKHNYALYLKVLLITANINKKIKGQMNQMVFARFGEKYFIHIESY